MKITLVNYEYPGVTENCGGGGEVTRNLADALRDRGHDVWVISDLEDGHYSTFPFRSYNRVAQILENHDIDVLNGHFSLPSSLLLPRLAEKYDTSFVCSVMGADVHDPTRFRAIRPVANRLNSHIFSAADAVVAPSTDMQVRLIREFGLDGQVIPYGVDLETSTPRDSEPPYQILTVCRLVERKNLHTAIESVRELRRRGIDAKHRIVGTGPLKGDIQSKASKFEWLSAPGYVEDLQAEYDAADVFFLPSRHEAFGMVYLEAMAHGLPAVASYEGGQTDFVEPLKTGDVASAGSSTEQADCLELVLENREELGTNAADLVGQDYSASRMAADYESLYAEVA